MPDCVYRRSGSWPLKAKELIGDRICVYGDVPTSLLNLGMAAKMDKSCHHLIEGVGKGGVFILGTGCDIPPDARPEFVKFMMESVIKYGYY